jgi:hypothetical protein
MKILFTIIAALLFNTIQAQQRGDIWCFGDSCLIDFRFNPPSTGVSVLRSRGTACSISDSSGNLLFYGGSPNVDLWQSGGVYFVGSVYNKNHEIMENGDTLACQLGYNEMIIVPDPNFNSKYYLFHMETSVQNPGLYYSVVDLSYNNGVGKVVSKNNQIFNGKMADCLNAIKHGNGKDWWVFTRKSNYQLGGPPDNDYFIYLVDTAGIWPQPVQSIGTLNPTNLAKITFNPNGEKFLFSNLNDLIELYDFDRCTGIISNPVTIQPNAVSGQSTLTWGAEFSPNGRYLYLSTNNDTSFLYQFDLLASNINSSRIIIDVFDSLTYAGGALKRGPNGKIYYASGWYDGINYNFPYPNNEYNIINMNLGVINQPDSPGVACNFQPFSFYLGGKRNYVGLPNNPDYDLPQLYGSACDTLNVHVSETKKLDKEFSIYPNPSDEFVNFYSKISSVGEIRIYDLVGKQVLKRQLHNGRVTISGINPGIYSASLFVNDKFQSAQKFIVIN